VTILSTGTLTGLADFINSIDDESELNEFIEKIHQVIVMGGAVDNEPGNIFTSPYSNIIYKLYLKCKLI
jgi:inosine-uridine nucleoside N-ribohydrolase